MIQAHSGGGGNSNRQGVEWLNDNVATAPPILLVGVAEHIVYGSFDIIENRTKEEPLRIFKRAVENIRPAVEVKSRRVGGSTYQVPVEIRGERRTALAFRWLILFSRKRHEKTMAEKLAGEIMDAAAGRGNTVKKKDDTHRMAEANKAFAHYRW